MILGVLGGSGLYDSTGSPTSATEEVRRRSARRRRRSSAARVGRHAAAVPAAPRPRPPLLAVRDQLPRQRVRAEDAGRRSGVLSVSAVGSLREELAAGRLRARRSVHRPDLPARDDASSATASSATSASPSPPARRSRRRSRRPRRRGGKPRPPRRHLRLHGGAAVLDARRVAAAPQLGRRRHRHDRRARGQAGPRGGALLRGAGAGHRLRRLARRRRRRQRRRRSSRCCAPTSPAPRTSSARSAERPSRPRHRAAARAPPPTPSSPRPTPIRPRRAATPARAAREGYREQSLSLLVVGSVALDSVETRAGKRVEVLGGAASYLSVGRVVPRRRRSA